MYCVPSPVQSAGDLSLVKTQGSSLQGTPIQLSATVSTVQQCTVSTVQQVSRDVIGALKKIKRSKSTKS